jgi:hypothetical protein
MKAVSNFLFDLFDAEAREDLPRTFPHASFTEQQSQEVSEDVRDLVWLEKSRELGRPCGVPSHAPSQKETESHRLAHDRVCRTDSGAFSARQTGIAAMDGAAVLNDNRGFTAGLFAQVATCAGRGYFHGAKRGDESNVLDLRLGASVGTG